VKENKTKQLEIDIITAILIQVQEKEWFQCVSEGKFIYRWAWQAWIL